MLDRIREALTTWRTELDAAEQLLEQKLQRLEYLQEAPLPRDELAAYVVEALLRHAEQAFRGHLIHRLEPAINNPLDDAATTSWKPNVLSKIERPMDANPLCLAWVLRDQIAAAITAEIEGLEGLPEAGPPRAERLAEIPRLEREIAELRERIEAERQAAQQAGVEAAQLHARAPVPGRTRDLKRQ